MDDAALVRRFQGARDIDRDRQRLDDGHRSRGEAIGECAAFDKLHDERPAIGAVHLLEAVDLRDVRVIERGEELSLAPKPREACRIGRHIVGQHFQRIVASELEVARAPDLAHSPDAEERRHLVRPDTGSRTDGHVAGILRPAGRR